MRIHHLVRGSLKHLLSVWGGEAERLARKGKRRGERAEQSLVAGGGVEPLEPRVLLSAVDLSIAGSPMAEAAGVATVTATLSAADVVDVTVNLGFGGSAAPGSDYNASGPSITILAGQLTGSLTLTAVEDVLPEPSETIVMNILNVVNGTPGAVTEVTAQITDNDAAAPVAADDAAATDEDTAVVINVLANDTDANGDALTAAVATGPANGTLMANADGTFTYTPAANFNGSDSFTYKASDGGAESNVATVTITVNPVNDAPVAADDSYSTPEDGALTIALPGVLGNDTDLEGDALTASVVDGPLNGTLALNSDGSLLYTPNVDFSGVDTFTYRATDAGGLSDVATVSITVVSAQQQLANLKAAVLDLRADGLLNKGLTNALSKKLTNAMKKLNRGQLHTSVNMLNAFTNHVEALIAGGKLSAADGEPLLNAAAVLEVSIATTDEPPTNGKAKAKAVKVKTNGNGGGEGNGSGIVTPAAPASDSNVNQGKGKKNGKGR